jgi:hypothetical protein
MKMALGSAIGISLLKSVEEQHTIDLFISHLVTEITNGLFKMSQKGGLQWCSNGGIL